MSKILIDEATVKLALDAMQRIEDADMDCDFLNLRQADQLEEAITALRKARAAQPSPAAQEEPVAGLSETQAKAILVLALDLEKTGRAVAIAEGQERTDLVNRNRNIQCALEDALRNATTPQSQPAREPTKAMIDAAERIDWSDSDVRSNIVNMWQAMCAATPQAQQEPLDLTAAIEYADARWAGVDLAIQWCRHFADALALQPAPDPTLTNSKSRAVAAIEQIQRKGEWITRAEAIEAIKGLK